MLRRILKWIGGLVGLVVLAALAIAATWYVDERLIHDKAVPRNVVVGGFAVGGLDNGDFETALGVLAADVAGAPLQVVVAPRTFQTTNAQAGIGLDTESMFAQAVALDRDGDVRDQFDSWWDSLWTVRTIEPVYTHDPSLTVQWLDSHASRVLQQPAEPSFSGANGKIEVVDGLVGDQLDPVTIAEEVAQVVASGHPPFAATAGWVPLRPAVDDPLLAEALAAADALADTPLTVSVGANTLRLGRETIRRWIDSEQKGDSIEPVLDRERIEASMGRILSGLTTEAVPPDFEIVDDEVVVTLGEPAEACCGEGVGELIAEAIETGDSGVIAMPLVPVETPEAQAARYGVLELVAEFTTNHACCASRVQNIQRMADIVRGAIILPGESFSLNGHVGQRTRDNGFIPAGTIVQGHLVDTVGGGVSQFATTTFNAAFFAGFDFIDYKAHSLYISRYPYGREATVNWPDVDLEFQNNTPYAAMLWTQYTGTSITVQVWSTPFFTVEQTGQSSGRVGSACTRVNTFRTRTDPEGRIVDDSVFAVYRPSEGIDCNGNSIPEPNV